MRVEVRAVYEDQPETDPKGIVDENILDLADELNCSVGLPFGTVKFRNGEDEVGVSIDLEREANNVTAFDGTTELDSVSEHILKSPAPLAVMFKDLRWPNHGFRITLVPDNEQLIGASLVPPPQELEAAAALKIPRQ